MCTRAQLKDITSQLVDVYRNIYGDDIVEILLYGSYARNEETDQSDVDIVAIVKGLTEKTENSMGYISGYWA